MLASSASLHAPPRGASPILMETIIQRFQPVGNLRHRLIEAGATGELLESLVVVMPGAELGDYRFTFVGQEVNAHIGRDISGQTFGHVIGFAAMLQPCLDEFRQALDTNEKIISRHRYDFSEKWMIEYSRIIYPLRDRAGMSCAVAFYLFHERDLEGRYF